MVQFDNNRPIYLQIYDGICEQILSETFKPEERIPSVREYASTIGVNPNTVMRTYERLTSDEIIFNKRGIGYFVSLDGRQKVLSSLRDTFLKEELPAILKKMRLLEIEPSVLEKALADEK